ncbi:STAS domain-containing protein [Streptomyces sp. NPDC046197]|uniref:STAS domain-containing protein n=1 Tax=Streptomyces sp. NPDC046197 TaxID=3154337 RepID=UPI0034013C79
MSITRGTGSRLRLAAPSASVARLFQIVGLDDVIACHPTVRDALHPWPRGRGAR